MQSEVRPNQISSKLIVKDHIVIIQHVRNLPDSKALSQGETEDKSSEDTEHRSSPADEESCSQFKPGGRGVKNKKDLIFL